jgi:response regulator RpfG family c-di-GMP phosphodiesterase
MNNKQASILIVDDDEQVRSFIVAALGSRYLCLTASTAEEAGQILSVSPFNLLLIDINLPGRSGLGFCRLAQRCWPEMVVVMVSGQTDIESAIEAMRRGAFDYIVKPFDLARLQVSVERALHFQELLVARREHEHALENEVRERTLELRSVNDALNQTLEVLYTNYRATLGALDEALEARDCETHGHSGRVVAYCLRLGREMGLTHSLLIALEQGAMLHDIGKIGVRDSILLKPGPLTKAEWIEMREHINHGLRIIDRIDFLSGARPVVSQHHEKYNGDGYPLGLHGDEIHVNARIFAVADAFDAITSDRPYRAAAGYDCARSEIVTSSGTHFDPKVVDAFLRVSESEWIGIRAVAQAHGYEEQVMNRLEIRSFIISLKSSQRMGRVATAP